MKKLKATPIETPPELDALLQAAWAAPKKKTHTIAIIPDTPSGRRALQQIRNYGSSAVTPAVTKRKQGKGEKL